MIKKTFARPGFGHDARHADRGQVRRSRRCRAIGLYIDVDVEFLKQLGEIGPGGGIDVQVKPKLKRGLGRAGIDLPKLTAGHES